MKHKLIIVLFVVWMVSCGRKQESQPVSSSESRAFALERENFFSSLKNQDDLTSLAQDAMAFNGSLLNDADRFYQYTSNNVKAAANLGVYISDLNYCVLYKEKDEIKKYFQASYELSKAIQVDQPVLEFLRKRYENNIEQNDSVKAVINQLFSQSTTGLKGTDRERLAGIAMTGYQIENLHLALTTLELLPDNLTTEQQKMQQQLIQYVLDQRGKFEVVYHFVRAHSDPLDPDKNPNYPFFDNGLRELIEAYQHVTGSDSNLNDLHEKVKAIRNKIVQL